MVDEQTDIVSDYDYYDPDDDPATDNAEGEYEATEGDTDETPDVDQEAEQDAEQDNPDEESEADEDPVIDLGDEQIPLSKLKEERMRQQDYSRKTAEVARERETVQQAQKFYSQQSQQLNSLLQNTVEFLQSVIPDEPPLSLAQSNPSQYQYQKELRSRAMAEVQQLVQKSQQVQQNQKQTQQFQSNQQIQQHVAGLERSFPHLKGNQEKLVSFVQETRQKATEFGFTPQEIANVTDNRLLEMAHYAALGKKAEHNRNNAKRRLAQPQKGQGRPAGTNKKGNDNRRAMQRLSQTGSLRDALAIDFE